MCVSVFIVLRLVLFLFSLFSWKISICATFIFRCFESDYLKKCIFVCVPLVHKNTSKFRNPKIATILNSNCCYYSLFQTNTQLFVHYIMVIQCQYLNFPFSTLVHCDEHQKFASNRFGFNHGVSNDCNRSNDRQFKWIQPKWTFKINSNRSILVRYDTYRFFMYRMVNSSTISIFPGSICYLLQPFGSLLSIFLTGKNWFFVHFLL